MKTVSIKDEINSSLEYNDVAKDFIDKINEQSDKEFQVDFSGIRFVSRSFAQAYFSNKVCSDKIITEVNVPEDVKPVLDIIRNKFE